MTSDLADSYFNMEWYDVSKKPFSRPRSFTVQHRVMGWYEMPYVEMNAKLMIMIYLIRNADCSNYKVYSMTPAQSVLQSVSQSDRQTDICMYVF